MTALARWRASAISLLGASLLLLGLLISPRTPWRTLVEPLAPLSGLLAVAGVLLLVGGAVLALARRYSRRLRCQYSSPTTIVLVTLGAWLLSTLAVAPLLLLQPGTRRITVATFLLAGVVLYAALLGAVYWLVIRPGHSSWRAMGLSPADATRTAAYWPLATLGLFAIATATEWALQQLGVRQTQLDSLQWLRQVPLWQYLLVAVMAAVVAPVVEEIYFRGWVFRALRERYGAPPAYLGSSLLFALVHLNVQALVPILAIALFLAYVYQRTGSIVPGIIAHAFNNALAFAVLYFGR